MNIRKAEMADLPALLSAVEEMVKGSTFKRTQTFDKEHTNKSLWFLIQDERAVCLILEDGKTFAGAYIGRTGENLVSGEKWLGEIFFWTDPKYRGHGSKLLSAAEGAAQGRNIKTSVLSHPSSNPRAGKFYERKGYELTELVYRKAL